MNAKHAVVVALALLASVAGCGSHSGEGREKEVAMTVNDLPPKVRATLDRESAGGTMSEIEREVKKGRTIYSADVVVNGVAWDIAIAEDGTLVSREREQAGEKD